MVLAPSLLAEFLFLQIAYAFGAAIIPAVAGVAGEYFALRRAVWRGAE
jgi:hypothetical protein